MIRETNWLLEDRWRLIEGNEPVGRGSRQTQGGADCVPGMRCGRAELHLGAEVRECVKLY